MSAIHRLMALGVGHYVSAVGFRIATALSAVHLGLSPAAIGLVLATFALVPMLFAVKGGRMVDRVGVRRPMLFGTGLAALGAMACALVLHPAILVVTAGMVGLGMMSFHLGLQHAAGEMGGPTRRTGNFNLLSMSFSISGLIGPALVGVIIDLAGHRVAFATTAILLGLVLIGVGRFAFDRHLPGSGRPDAASRPNVAGADPSSRPMPAPAADAASATATADPPADGAPPSDGPPQAASTFALLGAPRLRRLLIASLLASAAWDTFQFAMPLHGGTIGLSATSVGLAISSYSAGSLLVRLLLPRLLARMAPARWMKVALLLCVLAYAATPFASSFGVLIALAFLIGIGPGIAQPLLMAALHGASPPGRAGEAAGLRLTLISAMQLAVPVGLGLLATVAGTASLFWVYAAVTAGVGAWLAWAHRRAG
jgi:MFS family permease